MQTKLNQVCGTICNDVVHLHSLADCSGNHGKSSHGTDVLRVWAGLGSQVTRFVCAKCSETGQLSSRGLFLSRAAVLRHIAASKPCCAAKMGFREIQVDVRTSDGMAGAGRRGTRPARPIPARRYRNSHQSFLVIKYFVLSIPVTNDCTLVA